MERQTSDALFPEVTVRDDSVGVRLPEWVNELVFDRFGASHRPAGRSLAFNMNLDADEEKILNYLGTYFPRSVAETFVIFDSLLSDKTMAGSLASEDCVRVCSVGTGTGGDLLGLLLAIAKRVPSVKAIDVASIEGNADAHSVMREIIFEAAKVVGVELSVSLVNHVFEAPRPFANLNDFLPRSPDRFDFVICSKMLNELDGTGISERPYYEFCSSFSQLLRPMGTLMVLDVTSPNGAGGRWTPEVLNKQVNDFLSERQQFKSILPPICNRLELDCGSCYSQNVIHVSHREAVNECSKICYRVIGSNVLSDQLLDSIELWSCPIREHNLSKCNMRKH
ncbi:hypothetical protein [Olsenella intestinalis]|uniref:hypothetical protein n=1 Tax=Olsenella intestinalis TaxID=2930083 RepID=UPI00200C28F7|nr:hypothetical protein [Olsenella intestinalis]